MRVWFDHGEGLTTNGGPVAGFELAGEDRRFVPGQARLDGDTVVVFSPEQPHPLYVRYAWLSFFDKNLYNGAGLPASTFSSDDDLLR